MCYVGNDAPFGKSSLFVFNVLKVRNVLHVVLQDPGILMEPSMIQAALIILTLINDSKRRGEDMGRGWVCICNTVAVQCQEESNRTILNLFMYVCMSVCPSVCLSVCLCVCVSVCLCVCVSVCLCVCVSVCLCVCVSVCLCVCVYVCMCVCVYVCNVTCV